MNEDSQHSVATPLRELDTGPFSIGLLSDGSREGPGEPGSPPYFGWKKKKWLKKEEPASK